MFISRALPLALAIPLLLGRSGLGAEGKADQPPHVGVTGSSKLITDGDDTFGYCNGVVVFDKGLPVACFGLNKRPKDKGKYLYFLLFKTSPGPLGGLGTEGNTTSREDDEADDTLRITLGKKVIEVAYKYTADKKTHALKSETITVGKSEIKKGDPRVLLVDLTKEVVTYRAIKVALPDEVPDLTDSKKKTWPGTVLRAVEQLRKKSPEVAKFLRR
jgi:hypothetical protein